MQNTMIGGFIQYDMYNQVILGDTIEAVYEAARTWLINKGVDVPKDVPFDEWYDDDENVPTNVYFWEPYDPIVVVHAERREPQFSASVTFHLEQIPTVEERAHYVEQISAALNRHYMEVGFSRGDNAVNKINVEEEEED